MTWPVVRMIDRLADVLRGWPVGDGVQALLAIGMGSAPSNKRKCRDGPRLDTARRR
jgi:hypothetical protein